FRRSAKASVDFRRKSFPFGEYLVEQGRHPGNFFLLHRGHAPEDFVPDAGFEVWRWRIGMLTLLVIPPVTREDDHQSVESSLANWKRKRSNAGRFNVAIDALMKSFEVFEVGPVARFCGT